MINRLCNRGEPSLLAAYHSELQKYSPVYPIIKKETASHRYRECVEITDSHGRTQFDAGSGIYSDDACSCFF